MRSLLSRGGPEADGQDREQLVRALAHAKNKIAALQQALAGESRRRAAASEKPWAAAELAARSAAQRQAIAALAQGVAAGEDLWPELGAPSPEGGGRLPLRVAIASDKATMARNLRDPRLLVGPLQVLDQPDLVVIPRAENDAELQRLAREIPSAIWARAARAETKLVLDASLEGHTHKAAKTDALHRLLGERSVTPANAVYLTQDRGYRSAYEAYCARTGEASMPVWVYDFHVQSLFRSLEEEGERIFQDGLAAREALGPSRPRRFLSMSFNPRPTKVLFLLWLMKNDLWDDGLISFAGFDWLRSRGVTPESLADSLLALRGFADLSRECLPWLEKLEAAGPLLLGAEPGAHPRSVDRFGAVDLPEYRRSWFSVVPETEMSRRLHRVTEKSFKPLLNFHPILVLGGPGALKLVRAYGFQTFNGLFDEAYDEEPEPRRRFEMVCEQVDRFCRMEESELASRVAAFEEQILFNARWGLAELPAVFRRRIDVDVVSRLIAFAHGQAGGAPAAPVR